MILIKVSLMMMVLFCTKPEDAVKPYISSYIETYKFVAIDEMVKSGIPASIIMAQAIVESNAGASSLARESNNHFGIKCKDYWEGSQYYHPDDDKDKQGKLIPSCFRKYDSVNDSYKDHTDFLMHTDHYKPLFAYDKTDYELWAMGLEICGYASQQGYGEQLIRTIKLYNLHELDYYTIQYVDRASLSPK
ncbi:MAG: glucosaminidase domain-containing protein [Saprospiraceae bacterium]|uniref:Glucosaminidase domain-containing protein n=1 Tax=Candidatus Opimibacter skivensis TaxID=2982028 RepID=A0A9D7SV95_9BACT|nr:glucosaminidase domain-containing protein [Candidatus Opimibacter skivensis]